METLRQWAAVSDGFAVKVEDCRDAGEIARQIKTKLEAVRRSRELRRPFGVTWWAMALAIGCLAGEWTLRQRWRLV
jgi:hypothetical protein